MSQIFENEYGEKKWCKQCNRPLPKLYKEDICPVCQELNLFTEVKDYIRTNEVNENDVAEHFGLPARKVREWIREGRIQYKGQDSKTITSIFCQMCGKPIEFGTLCPDCHKLEKLKVVAKLRSTDDSRMRFLDKDGDK